MISSVFLLTKGNELDKISHVTHAAVDVLQSWKFKSVSNHKAIAQQRIAVSQLSFKIQPRLN